MGLNTKPDSASGYSTFGLGLISSSGTLSFTLHESTAHKASACCGHRAYGREAYILSARATYPLSPHSQEPSFTHLDHISRKSSHPTHKRRNFMKLPKISQTQMFDLDSTNIETWWHMYFDTCTNVPERGFQDAARSARLLCCDPIQGLVADLPLALAARWMHLLTSYHCSLKSVFFQDSLPFGYWATANWQFETNTSTLGLGPLGRESSTRTFCKGTHTCVNKEIITIKIYVCTVGLSF